MAGLLKLVSIVGARPQFVKIAPIVRAIEVRESAVHHIVHTGQHYDDTMSAAFFDQLDLPRPAIDLGVGSGSHAEQTARMLTGLEEYFQDARPDAVLTYGDTNSTLAATLAAAKIHIPVAHVEAGLRSFNRHMPEEINRLVADHCSDRLYAPTPRAMQNLSAENLSSRAVISGDVMLDAIRHNIELAGVKSSALRDIGLQPGEFGLVTIHRPVNTTGEALRLLLNALEETVRQHLRLVFPVHPRTRLVLNQIGYNAPDGLLIVEPMSYLDMISLIQAARLVITDSGGVQKEAAFLHTQCLTMRDETEWTETIEMGVNQLVGNDGSELVATVGACLDSSRAFDDDVELEIRRHYGAGDAAQRIIDDCLEWFA